jgi:hypothetical protein
MKDNSLLMLVGDPPASGVRPEGSDQQAEREELTEYMKQVCLGYEKAPSYVVAVLDAALAVCQEWRSHPKGRNVPLPPPALRQARGASGDANTDYQPSLKSVAYTPCLPEPPSVLAMMAVRKVNSPPVASP